MNDSLSGRAEVFEHCLEIMDGHQTITDMQKAIAIALHVPRLPGSPHKLYQQAEMYKSTMDVCRQVMTEIKHIAGKLQQVWNSDTGVSVSNQLGDMGSSVLGAIDAFGEVPDVTDTGKHVPVTELLRRYAGELNACIKRDDKGRELLTKARTALQNTNTIPIRPGGGRGRRLEHTKRATIDDIKDGFTFRKKATEELQAAANHLRMELLIHTNDALYESRTALAQALSELAGKQNIASSLSPIALSEAWQRFSSLSKKDQNQFLDLQRHAKSTDESSYLWQALSAGYSVPQVKAFDHEIHGKDDKWLEDHLTPRIDTSGNFSQRVDPLTYQGYWQTSDGSNIYDQGHTPYCEAVADSFLVESADPVAMLALTTGKGPAANLVQTLGLATDQSAGRKMASDTPAPVRGDGIDAFQSRLRGLYGAVNNYGSITIDHDQIGTDEMTEFAGDAVASHLSEKISGAEYVEHFPDGESERRQLLESIDASLKSGRYVILAVHSDPKDPIYDGNGNLIDDSHNMVITHSDKGRLRVVNPGWGFAKEVSYDDFIQNHLGSLTDKYVRGYGGGLPIVRDVSLPE